MSIYSNVEKQFPGLSDSTLSGTLKDSQNRAYPNRVQEVLDSTIRRTRYQGKVTNPSKSIGYESHLGQLISDGSKPLSPEGFIVLDAFLRGRSEEDNGLNNWRDSEFRQKYNAWEKRAAETLNDYGIGPSKLKELAQQYEKRYENEGITGIGGAVLGMGGGLIIPLTGTMVAGWNAVHGGPYTPDSALQTASVVAPAIVAGICGAVSGTLLGRELGHQAETLPRTIYEGVKKRMRL